jgi:hypothetical protein
MLLAVDTCNAASAFTVKLAVRLVLPWPLVVLVKMMVVVPVARAFALALTEKVIVVPPVPTVPEVEDGVSQLGTPEIEYSPSRIPSGVSPARSSARRTIATKPAHQLAATSSRTKSDHFKGGGSEVAIPRQMFQERR